jgi:hypothetical protein
LAYQSREVCELVQSEVSVILQVNVVVQHRHLSSLLIRTLKDLISLILIAGHGLLRLHQWHEAIDRRDKIVVRLVLLSAQT